MTTRLKLFASALFLIASNAYSMPANQTFSSVSMMTAWLSPTLNAQANSSNKAKKPKKSKAKKGGGVTFYDGSAESRAERDRRLKRECKGRPNSGACEGYTR
jgi:Mor family transcriptional regulator